MNFIENIKNLARENKKKIILPESMDERVLSAAEIIIEEDIAEIIIIGEKEKILEERPKLQKATFYDPKTSELTNDFIDQFVEMRKSKGMDYDTAKEFMLTDYMHFACMLVKNKMAHGIVSGACHSTSNTLRPALQIIKTSPNSNLVSSFFIMVVPNCKMGEDGVFIFSDSAINQNPTSEQLANIAYDSATNFESLLHKKAKVAFLSHSSHGSAKHTDIDKVVNAVKIAKEKYPQFLMDGELQLDAAIVPEISKSKAPNSLLKGEANVLIFPDLDAANIGYKLVQRFANAQAYGPICQGMAAAVNDLSRGCYIEDIVGTVALTAIQSNSL